MKKLKKSKLKTDCSQDQANEPLSTAAIQYKYLTSRKCSLLEPPTGSLKRISFEKIVIDNEVLGEGAFGFIQVATLKKDDGSKIKVAVKVSLH